MKFNHLNVPTHWRNYWTRYPEGHTILEALISWVSQVDSMVDNQNTLNANVEQFRKEIDAFIERFDDRLQDEVTQTLNDWQTSGFLDVVISEALQWELNNYIATNEQDKLSLTTQLQQTEQELNAQLAQNAQVLNVKSLGVKGDGVTDDTTLIQQAVNSESEIVFFPKGVYRMTSLITVPSDKTIMSYNGVITGGGFSIDNKTNVKINGFTFASELEDGDNPHTGVWVNNSENIKVIHNTFDKTRLFMRSTENEKNYKNFLIQGNTFKGDFTNFTQSDVLFIGGLNTVNISDNYFECYNTIRFMKITTGGSTDTGDGYSEVLNSYTKNLIVSNNIIKGSVREGKQVIDCFAGVGESIFSANVIEIDSNSPNCGTIIELKNSGLQPQTTYTNKQRNIIISDNVLIAPSYGDVVLAYGAYGMTYEGDEQYITVSNNIIKNTRVKSDLNGINIRGFHQANVTNNQIVLINNTYIRGINIGSCKSVIVMSNHIPNGGIEFYEQAKDTIGETFTKPFQFINVSNNTVLNWRAFGGVAFSDFTNSQARVLVSGNLLQSSDTASPSSWCIAFRSGSFSHVSVLNNITNAIDNSTRNIVAKSSATITKYIEANNSFNDVV